MRDASASCHVTDAELTRRPIRKRRNGLNICLKNVDRVLAQDSLQKIPRDQVLKSEALRSSPKNTKYVFVGT